MGEGAISGLPTGTVTFLITDIEGSTRLYHRLGARFEELLEIHREVCRRAFHERGGVEIACPGDGFMVAFSTAPAAVAAAVDAQRSLTAHRWPSEGQVRVRMGVHSGEARLTSTGGTYMGMSLHEAARVGGAGHGGQVLLSEAAHHLARGGLPVGVTARPLGPQLLKDIEGTRVLYELQGSGLPTGFPPLRTQVAAVGNLPADRPEPLGRASELSTITGALASSRLCTLVGPGGVGKTHLATAAAATLTEGFADGCWFADLTPVAAPGTPADVASAVATSLGAEVSGGLPALLAAISHRHLLLVLDNCEHVVDAAATTVSALLGACPGVRVLATSRERLGSGAERTVVVPPLGPEDAVALFCQRAAESAPEVDLTPDREFVERICARLDGLPLAIELAARRVRVLSPSDIATRLDDRFALLRGGERGVDLRQSTLEATIAWSYDLLGSAERTLLRRFAVFAGGADLAAVEAVCGGGPIAADDVLDLVSALVDRSLLTVSRIGDRLRYGMLESIRAYAAALLEPAELIELRQRHLRWYADRSWEALQRLARGIFLDEFTRMAEDGDNLRGAAAWALGGGDLDAGLRLAAGAAIHGMESRGGYFYASQGWISALLERGAGADDPALRGQALASAANASAAQNQIREGEKLCEEALALVLRHDLDPAIHAQAVAMAAFTLVERDPRRAMAMHAEAAELAAEGGAWGFRIYVLSFLANAALAAGDVEAARTAAETGLDEARRLGLEVGVARCLNCLAAVSFRVGDLAGAVTLADEAVATALGADTPTEVAVGRTNQAIAAFFSGDVAGAMTLADDAVGHFAEVGQLFAVVRVWAGAAALSAMAGDPAVIALALGRLRSAVELLGDPEATRAVVAGIVPVAEAAGMGHLVADLVG